MTAPRLAALALLSSACATPRGADTVSTHTVSTHTVSDLACALEETQVSFAAPLTLLHTLPAVDAPAEYPFADVLRAHRVRVEISPGDATLPIRVEIETSMTRLEGVARAASVPLFPARAMRFAGLVIPLANHRLRMAEALPGALRVELSPMRGASLHAAPERVACDDLRLQPADRFDPDELPPPSARQPATLDLGSWTLSPSPDHTDAPRASIEITPSDTLWMLHDGPGRWARVLYSTDNAALVGWVERNHHLRARRGYASGAGSSGRAPRHCHPTNLCEEELPLFADDRGALHPIGLVLSGAGVRLGPNTGALTRVELCDPDIERADGVRYFIPTARAAACATQPSPSRITRK